MRALLRVTLADGTVHERAVQRVPRHWRSWLMRELPYGTLYQGATWQLSRLHDAG